MCVGNTWVWKFCCFCYFGVGGKVLRARCWCSRRGLERGELGFVEFLCLLFDFDQLDVVHRISGFSGSTEGCGF